MKVIPMFKLLFAGTVLAFGLRLMANAGGLAEAAVLPMYAIVTVYMLGAYALGRNEDQQARAFKAYVHRRLDEAGIPESPGGPHTDAGCRVGDRLDIALGLRK